MSPKGAAQNVAQPTATVTRLQSPVIVQDAAGHTIVEISDRAGYEGVTVYSSGGDAAFLGFDKQNNGLMQLLGPGRKLFGDASSDGLAEAGAINANTGFAQVYPKSGKTPFPIPNYIQGSK